MADIDFQPNWRRIRAVIAVGTTGGVGRAAEQLHHSQPAVTRAVRELEQEIGTQLFERHHSGMLPTSAGRLVISRFQRAIQHLQMAERALTKEKSLSDVCNRLSHRLNQRQLNTLVTLARLRSEPRTAVRLGLTQPAISASLRQLENLVGTELFLRTKRGMLLTDSGEILFRYAKLAMREIDMALVDLTAWQGRAQGKLVVGTLPLSSALLVPKAVDALRRQLPSVRIAVLDGTYDDLLEALRCGEIDVLIGALRQSVAGQGLVQEPLFTDSLSIVTHYSHPLLKRRDLTLAALQDAEWIGPRSTTPARESLDRAFVEAGLKPPTISVESGNLSVIKTLLMGSERVTLVSPYQFHFELLEGQLCRLPIELKGTRRPIGMTFRRDDLPTQALTIFCDALRDLSRQFTPGIQPSFCSSLPA